MTSETQESSSVATVLRLRLKEMTKQKEEHMRAIKEVEEELQKLFAKSPKKPRGSSKDIDRDIAALEFRRTTTSLVLADEKAILLQIGFLERQKALCEERKTHEDAIQNKKAQLKELRDSTSLIIASIDELTPVLNKVELAEKLHCRPTQLQTTTVEFPKSKVGHVIGKNGSTIKNIAEKTETAIDVDADSCLIEITGTDSAIEMAKEEFRKITESTEKDVQVSPALVEYLTTRRLAAFQDLREQNPDVYFDVHRNTSTIHLEGLADQLVAVQDALVNLDIQEESRSLTSIEAGIIVGRKGVNINQLIDEHKVAIDVTKSGEGYTVTVIGPSSNVEAAVESIGELLDLNKYVTERIAIDPLVRSVFLKDSGAHIKQVQKDINAKTKENGGSVLINIDKDAAMEDCNLSIKARRPALVIALEMMDEEIERIMKSVVTVQVDPHIVPRIIGKSGANIKEMRKQGKGVIIEVDKTGKIQLLGESEDVEAVVQSVDKVVQTNQVERFDCDASNIHLTFRALVRAKSHEINALVSGMDLDEESSQIVLRGSIENIKIVKDMIVEFILNNYVEEVEFAPNDKPALLMGGTNSVVGKLAEELDVNLNVSRSNNVIHARGKKENVLAAKKRLHQFLLGGDGHLVSKILVSEQAIGAVIGKGGSQLAKLEGKHNGLKVLVDRSSGIITLRGPEQSVQNSRVEIIKILSSVRIEESISITPEQHAEISKPEVVRRVTSGIPVQVTVTDDAFKVRGIFADVRDTVALVKAHLTGVFEARVELDPTQFTKVSGAARDPSHFNRMKVSSNAEIDLDPAKNSIIIHGKRANVKKAKILVMGFLDFILPSNFEHVKVPKVFHSTVANAASLADIAALSGASVSLDRDLNSIHVQSSDPDKVKEASKLVKAEFTKAEKLIFVLPIDQAESWIIPVIIGKGGQRISALSTETKCRINVSRQELSITITGEDEESVANAKRIIGAAIDKAKRECVFVQLPSNAAPAFIGKSGANIQQFAKDHSVQAECLRNEPSKVKIMGQDDSVAAAKEALFKWIDTWEGNNAEASISMDKAMIPFVVGKDGSVINALQKDSGCRINLDRNSSTITLRGGTAEKRTELIEKIRSIIANAQEEVETERKQKRERDAERAEKMKEEKTQPVVAEPDEETNLDSRKDRTAEFAARPVGLSKHTSNASPGRIQNKSTKVPSLVGTAAGRNLFVLLASSDTALNGTSENETLSTSDISSNGNAAEDGPVYYKSASGFTVRV